MPTYYSFPENLPGSLAASDPRPTIRNTKSFSRMESSPARPIPLKPELEAANEDGPNESLIESSASEDTATSEPLPEGFDDLPSEIVELTDKFLESLCQRTHPAPLNVTQLSILFQEFYLDAFDHIKTHISNLYISLSSRKRIAQNGAKIEQQMLPLSEISEKKKNRKLLETKRLALEEAAERKVCEAVYDKLWRHKSTDDEARDVTLRSKTQALNVIGVKLEHLGVSSVDDNKMIESLRSAQKALLEMSGKKSPLAKLNVLREVHKSIVDVLSDRNSDSSADRILPTLIFCLIHSSPEISIISDLFFIQRFRASKAIDGESAYCLTNLEAAVSFIETVNLNTLKVGDVNLERVGSTVDETAATQESIGAAINTADEAPKQAIASRGRMAVRELALNNGRSQSETPFTPAGDPLSNLSEKLISAKIDHSLKQAEEAWENEAARTPSPTLTRFAPDAIKVPREATTSTAENTATITTRSRGLSYLTNPAADLAGTVVNTADVGLKTIGNTLENSYKFLFGKMDEKKAEMPKTLEDARKLVESPQHNATIDGSIPPEGELRRSDSKDRIVSKAGSTRTTDKNVAVTPGKSPPAILNPINLPSAALGVVGSSLRGIAGINVMRGFNRSSTNLTNPEKEKDKPTPYTSFPQGGSNLSQEVTPNSNSSPHPADLLKAFPDLASPLLRTQNSLVAETIMSNLGDEGTADAPSKPQGRPSSFPVVVDRFMTMSDVGGLKVSELHELLMEYKRLGEWVKGLEGN